MDVIFLPTNAKDNTTIGNRRRFGNRNINMAYEAKKRPDAGSVVGIMRDQQNDVK